MSDLAKVRTFLAARGVTTIVADAAPHDEWSAAFDLIAQPKEPGGVDLYRLTRYQPPCPA